MPLCRPLSATSSTLRFSLGLVLGMLAALTPLVSQAGAEVAVSGVNEELATNIRRHIGELEQGELDSPSQLQQRLKRAIDEAGRALGYYHIDFSWRVHNGELHLDLAPGDYVSWAAPAINILGPAGELPDLQSVLESHPFQAGERINHQHYEQYKQKLLNACINVGFLDARYRETELLVNLKNSRARAKLELDCKQRYHVKTIEFEGSQLKPALLATMVDIRAGDNYRPSMQVSILRKLQETNYFRRVNVNTEKHPPDQMNLTVQLKDQPRHLFDVGLGFGTDTGVRGKLRWRRPLLNSAGHSFYSEIDASQLEQEGLARYTIPLDEPLKKNLHYTGRYVKENVQDTDSQRWSVSVSVSDQLSEKWRVEYGVRYEEETYQQGSEDERKARYIIPSTNATYVHPNDDDWLGGRKVWGEISGSDPALGADSFFLRLLGGIKQVVNITPRHRFITRGRAGIIYADTIEDIPASQRFFTGGDKTVRGYDYESIAPKDENGELIGAKYLNVASLEYNYRFAPKWWAALFVDTGRAYNDQSSRWRTGAGTGIRWESPVGQIGADLAFPIGDEEKDGFRIHVVIGPML